MPGRSRLSLVAVLAAAFTLGVGVSPAAQAEVEFGEPGNANADATVYSPVFSDVSDDHTFTTSIRGLFVAGITSGCNSNSTEYCPDDPVTRGEMAAFLSRALELEAGVSIDFTDDDGHMFEPVIERLAANDITRGCNPPTNDRFCPDRSITRGQMAAFLTRALDLEDGAAVDFTDDDGHMFEPAIRRLAANDITRGCNPPENDRFCPDDPISRGQMAAFLNRALTIEVPPAVPNSVSVDREPAESGVGTRLTVCRDEDMSLMVRSAAAGISALGRVSGWEPSTFEVSAGEVDLPTDRWFLPAGTGCELLDLSWNPRANSLSDPLDSLYITSPFGYRVHPIHGDRRLHTGTDFDGATGDPIYAAAPGVVTYAGSNGGYGNMVEVKHAGGLTTRYAHMSSISVSGGSSVGRGAVVGRMGCTGSCTGSHLHFETREWGSPVDPMIYLR